MGKALASQFVEGLPRRLDNGVVLFVTAGDIEQPKDHAAGVGAQKAIHVSANPLTLDQAGDIGPGQGGKVSGRRRGGRRLRRALALERQFHRSLKIITEIVRIANAVRN